MTGIVDDFILFDSTFAIGQSNLTYFDDKSVVMGVKHGTNPVLLYDISSSGVVCIKEIMKVDSLRPVPSIVVDIEKHLYICSQDENSSKTTSYSTVKQLDADYNVNWIFEHKRGLKRNSCSSFQPTADGNLIFIHDYNDGPGAQGTSGVEIVKLDTNGQLVDTLVMDQL